jgi:hypothetical protein
VLPSTRARDRPLVHRVPGPDVGPVPLATAPAVLRVDRVAEPRDRAWSPRVVDGRDPYRSELTVPCGAIVPRDACGSVALPLPALDAVVKVRLARGLVRLGADLLAASRRVLPDVAPALSEICLIAPLVEVATPRLRLLSGLLRDARHEG